MTENSQAAGEVRRYALVNRATGYTEDLCLWDGVTPWTPPEGFDVVPEGEAPPWPPAEPADQGGEG